MATTLEARRHYRAQLKLSRCRAKAPKPCRKIKTCRVTRTTEKRKHFCRKKKNTRRAR